MTIQYQVLGQPGRDNALFVRIETGQSIHRFLFDCGEGCLGDMEFSEIQAIDELFLSHLHMDHIGGFDYFFRCVFNRDDRPNRIWGPAGTGRILHHRFRAFLWNLHTSMRASWRVADIEQDSVQCTQFELSEAFETAFEEPPQQRPTILLDQPEFSVEKFVMDHHTPSIAYVVRETPRRNIDLSRLAQLGLRPGPWMKRLKESVDATEEVEVDGRKLLLESLQNQLVVETQGDSIAYLTDFLLDEKAFEILTPALQGCKVIVCEGQYRHSDLALAEKNCHMTTVLAARLARRANAGELILFHFSDRYTQTQWLKMLAEAQAEFPRTSFPKAWKLDGSAI